jgi:hypothetical protein
MDKDFPGQAATETVWNNAIKHLAKCAFTSTVFTHDGYEVTLFDL